VSSSKTCSDGRSEENEYSNGMQAGFIQYNLYTININKNNRNCYNYRGFGHLVRTCKNRGIEGRIGEGRRLEYGNGNNRHKGMIEEENENNNNLNGE